MLNLTKDERRAIFFLLIVGFIGAGINILIKFNTPVKILSCYVQDIGKVNLNSADKSLLSSIPGIGDKLSQRIIEYRQVSGGFKEVGELRNIKGITDYKYEKIKDSFKIR
jgi:competence ComEA-like helix-hairpin-helix protein